MALKQIGIRLEEELIKEVKKRALEEEIPLQTLISNMITSYLANMITTKDDDNMITSYLANMITEPTQPQPAQNDNKLESYHDNKLATQEPEQPKDTDDNMITSYHDNKPKTHFHRATHLLGQETPEFVYETRYDENGEPYTVQLVNPEFLYGKVEKIENPPYDLNDPLEKKLAEMEAKYKY